MATRAYKQQGRNYHSQKTLENMAICVTREAASSVSLRGTGETPRWRHGANTLSTCLCAAAGSSSPTDCTHAAAACAVIWMPLGAGLAAAGGCCRFCSTSATMSWIDRVPMMANVSSPQGSVADLA